MASFMSYFGARPNPKQSARDAIVALRQQLQMIEKKEEYLQKKIDEELKKAKANAVSNKAAATAALRRKKLSETELERLSGTRMQLEMQVNTLESANMNAENLVAMKKASDALKVIYNKMDMNKIDQTMAEVNEQREFANDVAELISNPTFSSLEDEDELKQQLSELEQDVLNERLMGADHVPVHLPATRVPTAAPVTAEEDDEETQLRELQAALAM